MFKKNYYLTFYNSYLPDIAYPEQQNRASARGYSMGYIGSVILLLFNLSMVMNPELYGIDGSKADASMLAMKYSDEILQIILNTTVATYVAMDQILTSSS